MFHAQFQDHIALGSGEEVLQVFKNGSMAAIFVMGPKQFLQTTEGEIGPVKRV